MTELHGHELVREEYDALTAIAKRYYGKTAEDYFRNLTNPMGEVYLAIQDKHVRRLDIYSQRMPEIPAEINSLSQLQVLRLGYNQIQS
jgi:Leucine-rich repeat (LRR) protein